MVAAASAVAVAVNTAELATPETVAVRVSVFAVVPWVQEPTVATPCALVEGVAPVTEPLGAVTAKVTPTPGTGLPNLSWTVTDGAAGRVEATLAVCASPPDFR